MFSNVDKKTAEILKEAKLLLDPIGFTVSRVKEKKGPAIAAELMNGAYGKAAAQMIKDKVPDLTVRKICLKAIKDKTFDTCLDTLFTGLNKRAAFDNQGVFRLSGWSRQIHTGFLGPRATWDAT